MTEETTPKKEYTAGKFLRNVILKSLLLFLILNFALAFIPHGNAVGKISFYNTLWPGRVRLPLLARTRRRLTTSVSMTWKRCLPAMRSTRGPNQQTNSGSF